MSLSVENRLRVVVRLIERFEGLTEALIRAADQRAGAITYALEAATVRTAGAALALRREGFSADCMPQVRLVFELGVTAQWVFHHRNHGFDALIDQGGRRQGLLLQGFQRAGMDVPAELIDEAQQQLDEPRTAASREIKEFEKVCKYFSHGDGLYAMYRALSAQAHAGSPYLFMRFIELNEEGVLTGRRLEDSDWLVESTVLGMGLVHAGRAFDEWCLHKPRKQELQQAAIDLGVPRMLLPR